MEYKEYWIEAEEKDGEWFATIGRVDGRKLGVALAIIVSTGPGREP